MWAGGIWLVGLLCYHRAEGLLFVAEEATCGLGGSGVLGQLDSQPGLHSCVAWASVSLSEPRLHCL